jgi:hypothetical protein
LASRNVLKWRLGLMLGAGLGFVWSGNRLGQAYVFTAFARNVRRRTVRGFAELMLAAAILLAVGRPAAALEVQDLAFAEVIVTGTEEPERTRGFGLGLADVIVKLTGDARLAASEKIAPLLARADTFVERFAYEDRMKDLPVRDEQGTRERPHFLRVWFKEADVRQALEALGLRIWDRDRALLAVFLTIHDARGTFALASSGEAGSLQREVLQDAARQRAVPIALPTAQDISERDRAAAYIAGGDIERLRLDAEQLGAGAILSGALSITPSGFWSITWFLDAVGQVRRWSLDNVTFDAALKCGIETAARMLSSNAE